MWRILLLIQAFMDVIDTCKTEEEPFKNEGARVVILKISHLYVYVDFYDAQGQLNQQSEVGST